MTRPVEDGDINLGGQTLGTKFSLVSSPSVVTNGDSSLLYPYFNFANIDYVYIGTGGEGSSDISESVLTGTSVTVTPSSSGTTTYTLTVAYTRYANIYDEVGTQYIVSVSTDIQAVPLPAITSLTASPSNITQGDSTVLTPSFSNGSGIITRNISPQIYQVASDGVGITLSPAETTVYTLTVTSPANAEVTETVTVTVGSAPTATSLTSGVASISYGSSTTLTPVFSNGTGVITPGSISATSGTPVTVSPISTTTYTLTVTNTASVTDSITASVTVVPLPVATSLVLGSATITSGNSTTLTPTFSNGTIKIGTSLDASDITTSATSGQSLSISPTINTTYYMVVTNSLGAVARTSVSITVSGSPQATSLTPGTATLVNGNSTTLTPVFSNGTGVITPGSISATSGTPVTVSPTSTTTYTLTVTDALTASATTSSTITVIAAPTPSVNSKEFYVRNTNNQPSRVKEFYFKDSTEQWRLIKEGWFFDGSAWRQIFKYTPSDIDIIVSNNPVKPVSADESGFTGSGESKSNKNNSFDTATISDTTTYGQWIANGTTGNTITWTWASATPSPAYTTISFNTRIGISSFITPIDSGEGDCIEWDCCDGDGDRYCEEYGPLFTPPSSIIFEYALNGQDPSPTWVTFKSFYSGVDSSFNGTISSSDITSGLPSNINNLKIRATVTCPTGTDSNGTATLRVYDVWINTVLGAGAIPPTITSFAPLTAGITSGSNGALVSVFNRNGSATISSATISELGATVATLSTTSVSNTITTTITTPSSGTHTYTLTVTDSNGNTSSKDTTLGVFSTAATTPTITLSYYVGGILQGPSSSITTGFKLGNTIKINANFTGTYGQSIVTSNSNDSGLSGTWLPKISSEATIYYATPTATGTYTFTNTLNGSTPIATATLVVEAATPTPINATGYDPISREAAIYREYDYVNNVLTSLLPKGKELNIVCNYREDGASTNVRDYTSGTVVVVWQKKVILSDEWVDHYTDSNFSDLIARIIVTQPGYYRIKVTNTIGAVVVTRYSEYFTVIQRDRIRPFPSQYTSIKPIAFISSGNPGVLSLTIKDTLVNGLSGTISGIGTNSMYQLNGATVTLTEQQTNNSLKGYHYLLSTNGQNVKTSDYNAYLAGGSESGILTLAKNWDMDEKTVDWKTVDNITGSSTRTVTTTTAHGFTSGQKVLFTNIVGMIELNSQVVSITVVSSTSFTFSFAGPSHPYNQNYKGYVVGIDTYSSAPPTLLPTSDDSSNDYLYGEQVASINFPNAAINGSVKLYIRAGYSYSSGIGRFNGDSQILYLNILKNKNVVSSPIALTMPDSFVGSLNYSDSGVWTDGPDETAQNYTYIIDNVANLSDISIQISSANARNNRSSFSIEDPDNYQSGTIDIYDCYAIISIGDTTFDDYGPDQIYPLSS